MLPRSKQYHNNRRESKERKMSSQHNVSDFALQLRSYSPSSYNPSSQSRMKNQYEHNIHPITEESNELVLPNIRSNSPSSHITPRVSQDNRTSNSSTHITPRIPRANSNNSNHMNSPHRQLYKQSNQPKQSYNDERRAPHLSLNSNTVNLQALLSNLNNGIKLDDTIGEESPEIVNDTIDIMFQIDKVALAHKLLTSQIVSFNKLQWKLWKKYNDGYNIIIGKGLTNNNIVNISQVIRLINDTKNSNEFKQAYRETNMYLEWLSREWEHQKYHIMRHITDIFRLPWHVISKENELLDTFTINIFHQDLNIKENMGNQQIQYGSDEIVNNYSLINVLHEILYYVLPMNSPISEIIREFTVNGEIRNRINRSDNSNVSNYMNIDDQDSLRNKIIPHWKEYLEDSNMNIYEFLNHLTEEISDN